MTPGLVRRTVVFHGRVQQVGFRITVSGLAEGFPVTGWVRNEPDGTVCCVVEGATVDLDAFIDSILQRMRDNITSHDSSLADASGEFENFRIMT
tara:strand:- start:116 stop:397 length:282 start_codon:yes stop_codon:yes gene_type:complete